MACSWESYSAADGTFSSFFAGESEKKQLLGVIDCLQFSGSHLQASPTGLRIRPPWRLLNVLPSPSPEDFRNGSLQRPDAEEFAFSEG
jgi:hypothetical protein